jgi:threonine/homoserine/homoserine lactone efflux protein
VILIAHKSWFRLIGGIFLYILGFFTFIIKPKEVEDKNTSLGIAGNFLSIFILKLKNPVTIFSFVAIFSGLGMAEEN